MFFRVDVGGVVGRRIVQPAGRLFGDDVAIFEQICHAEPLPFRIDLEDLLSADDSAIDVLLRQKARGARLSRVPGYIKLRLASAAKRAGHPPARPRRRESGNDPSAAPGLRRVR